MKYVLTLLALYCNLLSAQDVKTFSKPRYTITYPSEWRLDSTSGVNAKFKLYSPLESDSDKLDENINLVIDDNSTTPMSLDKYAELAMEQVKTNLKNTKVIEFKKPKNHNGDYYKFIFTVDVKGFPLKFEQWAWMKGDLVYVLTLTTELTKFDKYKDVGEKILQSFTIKN